MPWLTWRSKEIAALYAELNATVHAVAAAASLAVVTPSLDGGPAGGEARRVDRAALPPSQSWRSVGLDLQNWPSGPGSPLVLRGTALSTRSAVARPGNQPGSRLAGRIAAASRLACSRSAEKGLLTIPGERPVSRDTDGRTAQGASAGSFPQELDAAGRLGVDTVVRGTPVRTAAPRVWLTALPLGDGPAADEPLGHALAAARCAVGLPGRKGRLRPGRTTATLCTRASVPSRRTRHPRHCAADRPLQAVRRRGAQAWTASSADVPGDRQQLTLSRSGSPAGSTYPRRRRSKTSGAGFAWRPWPRPTAATSCSTCFPTASPRSGSRHRR